MIGQDTVTFTFFLGADQARRLADLTAERSCSLSEALRKAVDALLVRNPQGRLDLTTIAKRLIGPTEATFARLDTPGYVDIRTQRHAYPTVPAPTGVAAAAQNPDGTPYIPVRHRTP